MLGKILGGRYQIARHLGGGGFGQTYLATDLHLPGNPPCVVKQLKPRMTEPDALQAARRLFDTEAQVLYTLGSHEQIPRLFAHFEENQDFYLVQEFIEGDVLSRALKARPQFSELEVIHLLQDVLTVLEFVHQQQVVHRDIKPSNLIRRQGDGRLILIDFGAVKQIGVVTNACDASVTIAVGSSGYMPNEQLAGKPRFSSDVYAVGMLAIQCLTGIYPRKLKEDPKTSEIIWRDQVQVSPEFANILDTMVRYDFRQRYESAKEALVALKTLTSAASVAAVLSEPKVVSFDGHLAWLERGDELFQMQRYREAITAYDRVIQAQANDYLAWFKRGIALENLKQYGDAAVSYERVVQMQPDDYLAWYKFGSVLEQLQRHQEALQAYDRVVALQPENYWAWHDRGKVLEGLQQYDDALSSYDRAVQIKPDFQLAIDRRKQVLMQLRRVDSLYHLQHYDAAVAACDQAIQQNPHDALAWFMRGMALDNLQRYEDAVAAYDRIVEMQPDDHVAWFKRGAVLEKLHRYEEAVASYYRVVQIQPDNYWAWNDRGRLLERLNQYEAAIASYDRAVQLKPDFQAAAEGRRRMLRQLQTETVPADATDVTISASETTERPALALKAEDLQQVIEDYKQRLHQPPLVQPASLEREETVVNHPTPTGTTIAHPLPALVPPATLPTLPQETTVTTERAAISDDDVYRYWLNKGRSLEKQQRYEDALHAYAQARQILSTDATVWRYQGNVLYGLERYEDALSAYQQALQLAPQQADIWCCIGGCYIRLKQYQDAIGCFEQAIQLQPGSYSSWYWRGRVLGELKQYDEALQSLNQAITLRPDFQPALKDRQRLQNQLKALALQSSADSVG